MEENPLLAVVRLARIRHGRKKKLIAHSTKSHLAHSRPQDRTLVTCPNTAPRKPINRPPAPFWTALRPVQRGTGRFSISSCTSYLRRSKLSLACLRQPSLPFRSSTPRFHRHATCGSSDKPPSVVHLQHLHEANMCCSALS